MNQKILNACIKQASEGGVRFGAADVLRRLLNLSAEAQLDRMSLVHAITDALNAMVLDGRLTFRAMEVRQYRTAAAVA